MSTQPEADNVSAETKFLSEIRIKTWLQISGAFKPDYHDVGEYYQIHIDCSVLDGCGLLVSGTLVLSANKGEEELVEKYRLQYSIGSLHRLESKSFCIVGGDITFHDHTTTPVMAEDEANVRKWFDDDAANHPQLASYSSHPYTSAVIGRVRECNVVRTKRGDQMAIIKLMEHGNLTLLAFPEQYAWHFNLLQKADTSLEFVCKSEKILSPDQPQYLTVDFISVSR